LIDHAPWLLSGKVTLAGFGYFFFWPPSFA